MGIQTVLGEIDKDEVFHAQCHEHLFIAKGKSYELNEALYIDDFGKVFAELKKYKFSGGNLVVDAQPLGVGRMADELIYVSKMTGVHIVASTGFHKLIFYPNNHWIFNMDSESLSELIIAELNEGMFIGADNRFPFVKVNGKAGIIKMAVDKAGLTNEYKRLIDGCVKASLFTNAPIQCHIEDASTAYEVSDYLLDKGVEPRKVILAHLDRDALKVEEAIKTAALGVYLELDTIGRFKYHDDLTEVSLIKRLIDEGFEDQLLISLDTTRHRLKAYSGEIGLDYILEKFIPLLKVTGIDEQIVSKMTVINPSNVLNK